MSKRDGERITINGTVMNSYPNGMFSVQTNGDVTVLATICGKIRQNFIKILTGDSVVVEVSPYDMSRGRIIKRLPKE